MEPCSNPFIPDRLYTNNRKNIQKFSVGDVIYRRCKNDAANGFNPFRDLKLFDISVNRATIADAIISEPEDVLYNINATGEADLTLEEAILTLTIREIDSGTETFNKCFTEESDRDSETGATINHSLCLRLMHECIPCNYAHSVIAAFYNDQLLTSENYDQLVGKKKGKIKQLRNTARIELEAIITSRQLWIERPNVEISPPGAMQEESSS